MSEMKKSQNKTNSKTKELLQEKSRILSLLSKLPDKIRNKVIRALSPNDTKLVCEIFINLLSGNITKSKKILNKLEKYRNYIRYLADKKIALQKKKKILYSKKGGFLLGALLPLAVTVLSRLIK